MTVIVLVFVIDHIIYDITPYSQYIIYYYESKLLIFAIQYLLKNMLPDITC